MDFDSSSDNIRSKSRLRFCRLVAGGGINFGNDLGYDTGSPKGRFSLPGL